MNEEKLLDDGIVITNLNDPRTTNNQFYQYEGEWIASASFSGIKQVLKVKTSVIRKRLKQHGIEAYFIGSKKKHFGISKSSFYPFLLNMIDNNSFLRGKIGTIKVKNGITFNQINKGFQTLVNYFDGIPSNHSIKTMGMINNTTLTHEDLDNTDIIGLSLALPAIPFNGEDALQASRLVNQISKKWEVNAFHNLATVDELTFEGFYRIYFDRKDSSAIERAHAWSKDLHQVFEQKGYLPYRIDNKLMSSFTNKKDDTYWNIVQQIKKTLDKNLLLSKGKYCPNLD